jgi:hypothetical protein
MTRCAAVQCQCKFAKTLIFSSSKACCFGSKTEILSPLTADGYGCQMLYRANSSNFSRSPTRCDQLR